MFLLLLIQTSTALLSESNKHAKNYRFKINGANFAFLFCFSELFPASKAFSWMLNFFFIILFVKSYLAVYFTGCALWQTIISSSFFRICLNIYQFSSSQVI